MTIVLVLGAGGSDGGQFIDGALAELAASTGFRPEHAATIIGTSIGAFRAAAVDSAVEPPTPVSMAVRAIGRRRPEATMLDRTARRTRLALGQTLARIMPRTRPAPQWSTPPGPYHAGAVVVCVDLERRQRTVRVLGRTRDPAAVVRASAAIPFAVGPVPLDGRPHGDGALWSTANADLAISTGATSVVVIAPMVPASGGSLLARLHRRQLQAELAELPPETSTVVVCPEPGPRRRTRTAGAGAAAVRAAHARLERTKR